MLPVIIDPACELDIESAQLWYGSRVDGLDDRFVAAIDTALERIQDHPLAYPVVVENVRRSITSIFPYVFTLSLNQMKSSSSPAFIKANRQTCYYDASVGKL